MRSEQLRTRALEALAPRREAYRSAIAAAVDEVRALVDRQRAPDDGKADRVAAELGAFAAGRIDTERFSALLSDDDRLDADALDEVEIALAALTELLEADASLYTCRVPAGGDLRDAVRAALARAGRAFGAGRAVESVRSGSSPVPYGKGFGPEQWNRAERGIAPPLVVEVEGADLRVAGLAEYLEGAQAIVLVVRKPAPPAALARLIVPGTLVVQDTSADALGELAAWSGPAVVAVVPEGAAVFRYRPEEEGPGELTVTSVPEEAPRAIGTMSAPRQRADLDLLELLEGAVTGRVVVAATGAVVEREDPADRLAAWLLRQATIPEPGEV